MLSPAENTCTLLHNLHSLLFHAFAQRGLFVHAFFRREAAHVLVIV
jgi:hypothetical protein